RPDEADRWLELESWVFRKAAVVFTKSEFVRGAVIGSYGCLPARVMTVGSGANLMDAEPRAAPAERPVALFVGLDFEGKGGSTLLDAWESVARRVPDAELWIVGPPQRASGGGIRWLGRVSHPSHLRTLYRRAAAFVMPSNYEPFGGVFLEAMGF